jgi:ribosomal protein S18 acetylase RimI-like enzyme
METPTVMAVADADAAAIRSIVALCNRHEGLDLAIHLTRPPVDAPPNQFVYHRRGVAVGVASIEPHQDLEVCIAVHPEHRRQGIGRRLLEGLTGQVRDRGRRSCLLVCEEASTSGRGFLAAVGARRRNAEHRMRLDTEDAGRHDAASHADDRTVLDLTPAGIKHLEAVGRVLAASFHSDPVREQQRVAADLAKPTHRYFLATLGPEPVGSYGLVAAEGRVYVIGFGVLPAYRGRGYGRIMLRHAVRLLAREGRREIFLEVATDNTPAVRLYQSAGFRVVSTYGFYELAV